MTEPELRAPQLPAAPRSSPRSPPQLPAAPRSSPRSPPQLPAAPRALPRSSRSERSRSGGSRPAAGSGLRISAPGLKLSEVRLPLSAAADRAQPSRTEPSRADRTGPEQRTKKVGVKVESQLQEERSSRSPAQSSLLLPVRPSRGGASAPRGPPSLSNPDQSNPTWPKVCGQLTPRSWGPAVVLEPTRGPGSDSSDL